MQGNFERQFNSFLKCTNVKIRWKIRKVMGISVNAVIKNKTAILIKFCNWFQFLISLHFVFSLQVIITNKVLNWTNYIVPLFNKTNYGIPILTWYEATIFYFCTNLYIHVLPRPDFRIGLQGPSLGTRNSKGTQIDFH